MRADCTAPCERNTVQVLEYQLQNLCEEFISICVGNFDRNKGGGRNEG